MSQMIHLVSSLHSLDQLKNQTTQLQTATEHLRAPLLAALRSTLQQGQVELQNNAPSATTSAPANGGNRAQLPPRTMMDKDRRLHRLLLQQPPTQLRHSKRHSSDSARPPNWSCISSRSLTRQYL